MKTARSGEAKTPKTPKPALRQAFLFDDQHNERSRTNVRRIIEPTRGD
jgi:hypothetical protein